MIPRGYAPPPQKGKACHPAGDGPLTAPRLSWPVLLAVVVLVVALLLAIVVGLVSEEPQQSYRPVLDFHR